MGENSLVKFKGDELDRIGNSIAITNKLLSLNVLKILIIYNDGMSYRIVEEFFRRIGDFEIDAVVIDNSEKPDYEIAIIKTQQKKYDVIVITTMFSALEYTSKLRADNNYKNVLIYILSYDRDFCSKNPKDYNITGFLCKPFTFTTFYRTMEKIWKKSHKISFQ